jgi:hydroxyethylthiazole kinase
LAERFGCTVCVSGKIDLVTDGKQITRIHNGHPFMSQVTAMGCAATAVIGAFLGVEKNAYLATQSAMGVMGIAGECAAENAQGPGTFQIGFIDALSALEARVIEDRLRIEKK